MARKYKNKRERQYISQLTRDLKKFREKEASGKTITAQERRNMRARERRAIEHMKKEAIPLVNQANETYFGLEEAGIHTLAAQRAQDEFSKQGVDRFTLENVKSYEDLIQVMTQAKTFLNSPDTAKLTATREETRRKLKRKYGDIEESLRSGEYVKSGLIPSEADAKQIFSAYRKVEEYWSGKIGKQGQAGVYGSDNLILYMIDVHNQGLDAEEMGMQALENFSLESTTEYQELFRERNRVTGITGLFEEGGKYGKLAGLL